LKCKEIPNEDGSLEESRSRDILLKIDEKKLFSKHHLFLNKIPIEDVTHYTVEAQNIAAKWKKENQNRK
jgi:hypothetical protein